MNRKEMIESLAIYGGMLINYMKMTGLVRSGEMIDGVIARDMESEEDYEIHFLSGKRGTRVYDRNLLEPKEAYYTFEWLDEAVDLAKKAGLSIVLCTPTAAPPVWLSSKYPETMMVTASGRRVTHGSRAHRCVNSKTFVRLAEGITLKIVSNRRSHADCKTLRFCPWAQRAMGCNGDAAGFQKYTLSRLRRSVLQRSLCGF